MVPSLVDEHSRLCHGEGPTGEAPAAGGRQQCLRSRRKIPIREFPSELRSSFRPFRGLSAYMRVYGRQGGRAAVGGPRGAGGRERVWRTWRGGGGGGAGGGGARGGSGGREQTRKRRSRGLCSSAPGAGRRTGGRGGCRRGSIGS